ncbi:MAG: DUF2061 domain-containing protein [Psychromonas sp.]
MIKTITFTSMHFCIAFLVTWLLTGDIMIGGLVAIIEPLVNSVGYFFHEKAWLRWGSKSDETDESSTVC